jgi:CRISPR-associated protein Csb2
LPEPSEVTVSLPSLLRGVEDARSFPTFRGGRRARRLVHARIRFPVEVAGPLVLGSGRYLGLGLMWPLDGEEGGAPA